MVHAKTQTAKMHHAKTQRRKDAKYTGIVFLFFLCAFAPLRENRIFSPDTFNKLIIQKNIKMPAIFKRLVPLQSYLFKVKT